MTFSRLKILSASAVLSLSAGMAQADPNAAMLAFVQEHVMTALTNDAIAAAVQARNAETAGLSEADILSLDAEWRAQVGTAAHPLIDTVIKTDEAGMLVAKVAESGGRITELFIMDARGLNVAASDITSDYWQGDEAKFQQTYPMGSDAVHISEVEFDESTSTYQGQVSFTLTDPASGEPIGAVTVGLDATSFF